MVGSDWRRIFFFSRLMNTEATRGRSSARPVSFSTIEARVTNSLMSATGRPGTRLSQTSSTSRFWWASILSMICWRVAPRVKRCVSAARLPSGDGQGIHHRLAALQQFHHVAHRSAGLDFVFAGLQCRIVAIGAHAQAEDARIADEAAPFKLVGDLLHARVRLHKNSLGDCRWAGPVELELA